MTSVARRRLISRLFLIIGGIAGIGGLMLGTCYWIDRSIEASHSGPEHVFDLPERPAILTDAIAIERARDVLTLDGYDLSKWIAWEDGRTSAPDGTRDKFFSRSSINPNVGSVAFNCPGQGWVFVNMELRGRKLVCRLSRGK